MSRRGDNIYQRKDGRWEARYIIGQKEDGKARYTSVYGRSYKEVKEKQRNGISAYNELFSSYQAKSGTVEYISSLWIKDNSHNWKESTECRYKEKLNLYILPEFGLRRLSDISTDEIESFITLIQTMGYNGRKPLGSSSASMVLTIFKQLRIQALKSDRQIRFVPECITVNSKKTSISVFTESEEKRLISYLKQNLNETSLGVLTCLFPESEWGNYVL